MAQSNPTPPLSNLDVQHAVINTLQQMIFLLSSFQHHQKPRREIIGDVSGRYSNVSRQVIGLTWCKETDDWLFVIVTSVERLKADLEGRGFLYITWKLQGALEQADILGQGRSWGHCVNSITNQQPVTKHVIPNRPIRILIVKHIYQMDSRQRKKIGEQTERQTVIFCTYRSKHMATILLICLISLKYNQRVKAGSVSNNTRHVNRIRKRQHE